MDKKIKGYITYFENLDHIKRQKRKEIIKNILEFVFTLLMFFCFWLLLILINI
jgi:hypothetical protein